MVVPHRGGGGCLRLVDCHCKIHVTWITVSVIRRYRAATVPPIAHPTAQERPRIDPPATRCPCPPPPMLHVFVVVAQSI